LEIEIYFGSKTHAEASSERVLDQAERISIECFHFKKNVNLKGGHFHLSRAQDNLILANFTPCGLSTKG